MAPLLIIVHAQWDPEASVWVATSDDVPGLATEAATSELLVEKLKIIIPELLAANGHPADAPIPFTLLSRRQDITAQNAA